MNPATVLPDGATVVRFCRTPESEAVYSDHGLAGRDRWGEGPWQAEPDIAEWRARGSALPRLGVRGPMGGWCGYVGLPPGHPLHGKSWGDAAVEVHGVHGGITYGDACAGLVCHAPLEGEPEHVWWLGFDCAHAWDFTPGLAATVRRVSGAREMAEHETYRTLAYVAREIEKLAAQLERAQEPRP